jgi:hypothetical protein
LKNSLSGEKGGRVENVGLHNRATFNDLDSGKESPHTLKKSRFEFFNRIDPLPSFVAATIQRKVVECSGRSGALATKCSSI